MTRPDIEPLFGIVREALEAAEKSIIWAGSCYGSECTSLDCACAIAKVRGALEALPHFVLDAAAIDAFAEAVAKHCGAEGDGLAFDIDIWTGEVTPEGA
ncbi:MAG: hypothetical protein AAF604_04480 [Acidobacteriota bacterium]